MPIYRVKTWFLKKTCFVIDIPLFCPLVSQTLYSLPKFPQYMEKSKNTENNHVIGIEYDAVLHLNVRMHAISRVE